MAQSSTVNIALKFASGLLFICVVIYGCRDQQTEIRNAVGNLLEAAYEKNTEKVKQYADFDHILDEYMKEQTLEGDISSSQRKAIIDELADAMCEISKEEYEMAVRTLRVEMNKKDPRFATAVYSTSKKKDIGLVLEKRKTGWIVITIR